LRARAAHNESATSENFAHAISLIERALTLDPGFPDARALLAQVLAARVLEQMTETAAADIERAEQLIKETLTVAPRSPIAHFAKAQIMRCHNQFAAAIPEFEIAIATATFGRGAGSNDQRCSRPFLPDFLVHPRAGAWIATG